MRLCKLYLKIGCYNQLTSDSEERISLIKEDINMRKKLLAVLMTGAMVASFAGSATAVFAKSDDDNKLT